MAKFISVDIPSNNGDVHALVNIDQIRYIRPGSKDKSTIHFADDHSIVVNGDPASIINQAFGK